MFFVPFAFAGEDTSVVPTTCNLLDIDTGTYIPCVAGKTILVSDVLAHIRDTGTEPSADMFARAFHTGKHTHLYDSGKKMSLMYSNDSGFVTTVESDPLRTIFHTGLHWIVVLFIGISATMRTSRWWVRPFSLTLILVLIIALMIEYWYEKSFVPWNLIIPISAILILTELMIHAVFSGKKKSGEAHSV